jgi:Holliday junction DNA helicase RuvA
MFERLRTVSGIGPRTALSILSSLPLKDLSLALVAGDANALTRVPGIGKKTAQRLVLELRDKVDNAELTGQAGIAPIPQGVESEAVAALMALGYASSEAARAVSAVSGQTDKLDELIFKALKGMGK